MLLFFSVYYLTESKFMASLFISDSNKILIQIYVKNKTNQIHVTKVGLINGQKTASKTYMSGFLAANSACFSSYFFSDNPDIYCFNMELKARLP